MDKVKQKKEKNWAKRHHKYIKKWSAIIRDIEDPNKVGPSEQPCDGEAFNRYLVWLEKVSHLCIQPAAFAHEDIHEEAYPAYDEMSRLQYNSLFREGRNPNLAPVLRFVVSFLSTHEHDLLKK